MIEIEREKFNSNRASQQCTFAWANISRKYNSLQFTFYNVVVAFSFVHLWPNSFVHTILLHFRTLLKYIDAFSKWYSELFFATRKMCSISLIPLILELNCIRIQSLYGFMDKIYKCLQRRLSIENMQNLKYKISIFMKIVFSYEFHLFFIKLDPNFVVHN